MHDNDTDPAPAVLITKEQVVKRGFAASLFPHRAEYHLSEETWTCLRDGFLEEVEIRVAITSDAYRGLGEALNLYLLWVFDREERRGEVVELADFSKSATFIHLLHICSQKFWTSPRMKLSQPLLDFVVSNEHFLS